MIGALMAGYLADRCGRIKAIIFGCLWIILGAALQASAYNITWMCFGRVLGESNPVRAFFYDADMSRTFSWYWSRIYRLCYPGLVSRGQQPLSSRSVFGS